MMIVTKKRIPRRTVLRGLGSVLALPFLDSMVPALGAARDTAHTSVRRLNIVYLPNGVARDSADIDYWTPDGEGAEFEFSPILAPLAPFRENVIVLSGLTQRPPGGRRDGGHSGAASKFLTSWVPERDKAAELLAATSMDQIAAKVLGQKTQFASLELGLDARDYAGSCGDGLCGYTNTISWSSPETPLPVENSPRVVFERLFGDNPSTDLEVRLARLKTDRSILDSVLEEVATFRGVLGEGDRAKIDEYLTAIRDVERRIHLAEQQAGSKGLPVLEQPPGIPNTFKEHADLMFDLQVLAFQSDFTRIGTFMIGREITGRSYREIGVPEAHHPLSHHEDDPQKVAALAKINTYQTTVFARYVEKLRATPDGDGSLLDHMMILYGAGMFNSNTHSSQSLPLVLLGGGGGQLKGGRHLVFSNVTPVANLHLTLLEKLGIPEETFGESTGPLERLSM